MAIGKKKGARAKRGFVFLRGDNAGTFTVKKMGKSSSLWYDRAMIWKFEPEIADMAYQIQDAVEAGDNDLFEHASLMAHGVERMLERYFPELATGIALDPQVTVERLLTFYAAIHEDTANQPKQDCDTGSTIMPSPRAGVEADK